MNSKSLKLAKQYLGENLMSNTHTQQFNKAIQVILDSVKEIKEKWAFVGSTASFLEGQDVNPSDIDIMTTKEGSKQFAAKLEQYTTIKYHFDDGEKGSSWYVRFDINGIEVEVMGDLTVKGDTDRVFTPENASIWNFLNTVTYQNRSAYIFPDEYQIITNATSKQREYKVAEKSKYMLESGFNKELLMSLIKENNLSEDTISRIKKYLPLN